MVSVMQLMNNLTNCDFYCIYQGNDFGQGNECLARLPIYLPPMFIKVLLIYHEILLFGCRHEFMILVQYKPPVQYKQSFTI